MSLINDALQRAKQNHGPPIAVEAGAGVPMRPVEQQPQPGTRTSPAIIVLLAVVLALAGALFYLAGRNAAPGLANLAPLTVTPPVSPAAIPAPPMAAPTEAPPVVIQPEATPVRSVAVIAPEPTTTVVVPTGEVAAATVPTTEATPIVVVTNPLPVALRLQGISYLPTHPSAVINGKTVFVGDRVAEARVLAITGSSVTLLQSGQTNVLSLE